jgi:YegS/Rv2252/BmrU family lipid kinase
VRIALISNPESGSGEALEAAERLEAAGAEVETFEPADSGRAARAGADRIAVAGGDGSIGCAAAAAAEAEVPLAVIPAGTANDFARAYSLPDDLGEAVALATKGSVTKRIELAWMGDRPFVNAASAGLAPAAAERAHGLKRALGPAAYAVGAVRAATTASPIRCRATCEGSELFAGDAWQVTIASSGSFGGGSDVNADPQDGKLDLVVLEAGPRVALARRAYGLRSGSLEEQDGVASHRCPSIDLDVPAGTSFNVDGEVLESGPVSFTVRPAQVELVVP